MIDRLILFKELVSKCGVRGKSTQQTFKIVVGNKGFRPQIKPPVHIGGFGLAVE